MKDFLISIIGSLILLLNEKKKLVLSKSKEAFFIPRIESSTLPYTTTLDENANEF